MQTRNRNRLFVSIFLLGTVAFTVGMTFWIGPGIMGMREEIDNRDLLYKGREIPDAGTLVVQKRAWTRPNTYPMVTIQLAGLDTPPLRDADDAELIAWAERHEVTPQHAARMASSARQTLTAFVRMQNMVLKPAEGDDIRDGLNNGDTVHVFVAGTDVSRKQILQGLAFHNPDAPQLHSELYAQAQAEARERKRGLWSE